MHNEISPPGLITNSKCMCRQEGEHFNMVAKYCMCNHTLNTSGILSQLLPYRNTSQPRKDTYVTDTHKHVLKTEADGHNL